MYFTVTNICLLFVIRNISGKILQRRETKKNMEIKSGPVGGVIAVTICKIVLCACLSGREELLPDSAFAEERFVIFDIIIKNLIKKMQCGFVSNGNFHNFVSAS